MEHKKVTYSPREIVEYIERKDSSTINSKGLEKDWEYDKISANVILSDLEKLGIILPEEIDVGGRKVYVRNYHLTEFGKKMKDSLRPRTIILTNFPIISRITKEEFNYLMEILQIKGIGPDELKEMLESNSPELGKLIKETQLPILQDLSPEELRQLAKEVEER